MLALAYAALAALLLALNLKTPYARPIKLAGIVLVTLFYIFAYHGSQNMRGWAIADTPPNPFKLHWAVIEEPDKIAKTSGAICCWHKNCRIMARCCLTQGFTACPFSPELADAVEEALSAMEGGKPMEGRLSYKVKKPETLEDEMQKRDGRESRPDSKGEEERLKLSNSASCPCRIYRPNLRTERHTPHYCSALCLS